MAKKKKNHRQAESVQNVQGAKSEVETPVVETLEGVENNGDTEEVTAQESTQLTTAVITDTLEISEPAQNNGEAEIAAEVNEEGSENSHEVNQQAQPDPESASNKESPTSTSNQTSSEDSHESKPDKTESKESAPAPKKRLTLQERLALAAGKKKKISKRTVSETLSADSPRSSLESVRSQGENKEVTPTPLQNSTLSSELSNAQEPEATSTKTDQNGDVPENLETLSHEQLLSLVKDLSSKLNKLETSKVTTVPVTTSTPNSVTDHLLKEKDEKITQLLKEGEELSRKELKHSTVIKKLRAREHELEFNVQKLEDSIISLKSEKLTLADELKELQDAAKFYQSTKTSLELKLSGFESSLKEQTELARALTQDKTQLNKEIISLQKKIDKEHDRTNLIKSEYQEEIVRLESKIEALRTLTESSQSGTTLQAGASQDESYLKLVKQYDLLQNQYTSATSNWQSIEASLRGKVDNLEYEKSELHERVKSHSNKVEILTSDLASKSHEIEELNQTISSKSSELTKLQERVDFLESELQTTEELLQETQLKYTQSTRAQEQQIDALQKRLQSPGPFVTSNSTVQSQSICVDSTPSLSLTRHSSTSSFKRQWDNRSEIKMGESSTTPVQSRKTSTVFPPFNNSTTSLSIDHSLESHEEETGSDIGSLSPDPKNQLSVGRVDGGDDHSGPLPFRPSRRTGSVSTIFHEEDDNESHGERNVMGGSSVQLLSKMSSQVRRLEMELATTKEESLKLIGEKKLLNLEIVKLMKDAETANEFKAQVVGLERKLKNVEEKYEKTLIILGEKSEKVEELKCDVEDLKEMLREQVQQLVALQS